MSKDKTAIARFLTVVTPLKNERGGWLERLNIQTSKNLGTDLSQEYLA